MLNQAMIVGRVGKDPAVNHSNNGTAITNLSVATSEKWKDKNSGEMQERTEWHKVVCFGRTAEVVGDYVKKGALIFVTGRLQTNKWQDKDQIDRYTTEIVASQVKFLSTPKNTSDNAGNSGNGGSTGNGQQSQPQPQQNQQADDDFPDDDIPF